MVIFYVQYMRFAQNKFLISFLVLLLPSSLLLGRGPYVFLVYLVRAIYVLDVSP